MDNNQNEFKQIKENLIVIDLRECNYLGEIHQILKNKFGLPEYYGQNWDALWDCLDGLFFERGIYTVEIYGFFSLEKNLRKECETMISIFDAIHTQSPNFSIKLIS